MYTYFDNKQHLKDYINATFGGSDFVVIVNDYDNCYLPQVGFDKFFDEVNFGCEVSLVPLNNKIEYYQINQTLNAEHEMYYHFVSALDLNDTIVVHVDSQYDVYIIKQTVCEATE